MKKAFDQTIRDLKREVNKKVLKVPSIEQKVLDATSNEPWGPHGSLLADIAQATRNYHEYQMIMTVIWRRINSTGKNWRHVYKALTVLDYLVANGSERVIDEIREHAYQISTLSSFQYIDSSGKDQGLNVRRKSQSLVSLVNDKERIEEVRQKAASNRDKFKSTTMGRPGYSGSGYGDRYDDDRYEGRYGYGREGEWGNRDDDRYGRYADSYARDGDRYSRDSEERYGGRDDDYRARSVDENQYGSRSSDRDRDHAYDDEHYSSRGSSVKTEDHPQEGRPLERKFSEQNLSAPPSYEEAVGGSKSPAYSERDGETPAAPAPKTSSPAAPAPKTSSPAASASPGQITPDLGSSWSDPNNKAEAFDEFDPRGSNSAVPVMSNNAEMDLIGSLSDSLAITPVSTLTPSTDPNASDTFAQSNFTTASSSTVNQSFEDPFGDSPFKAIPSSDGVTTQAQNFSSVSSFQPPVVNNVEQMQQVAQNSNNLGNLEVPESFSSLTFSTTEASAFHLPPTSQPMQQEPSPFQNDDILAGILPPSGPPPASQPPFLPPTNQPVAPISNASNFVPQSWSPPPDLSPMPAQNLLMPTAQNSSMSSVPHPTSAAAIASNTVPQMHTAQNNSMNTFLHSASAAAVASNMVPQVSTGQYNGVSSFPHSAPAAAIASNTAPQMPTDTVPQLANDVLGDLLPLPGPTISPAPSLQPTFTQTTGSLALVSQPAAKEKFEPKSAVWADTLTRGLVNLDISGPKVNPNADIGIDFESLNRKEKRMEKPTAASTTSTVSMGKAMGSGSGMSRSGANILSPPSNPMMGSGMGMSVASGGGIGMGMGGTPGVGMGSYGMMNQRPSMSMGIGTGIGGNMGMGMGQGPPMQPSNGLHPGSNMSGGYNPMMGRGGYPQQPYGSGYQ